LQILGFLSSLDVLEQRRFWRLHRSGRKTSAEGGPVLGAVRREVKSEESRKNGSNKFYTVFYFNVCFYSILVLFGKVGMSEWNVFVDCSSEVSKEKTKETLILLVLSTQTHPIKNSQAKNN